MMQFAPQTESLTLACREIWGGTGPAQNRLSVPGLEAWVFARPHRGQQSGGDIHYVGLCGHGILSRFVVADVSGHGPAVSDLANDLRELLRRNMDNPDQAELMKALNRDFGELAQEGTFATAVVCSYIALNHHLVIANAGHPRPIWREASKGKWQPLHYDMDEAVSDVPGVVEHNVDLPLGVIGETGYQQFAVELSPGETVVFHTDSLTEVRDDSDRMLCEEGLIAMASRLDPADPETFGRDLLEAVQQYAGPDGIDDDITLLVLHHTGNSSDDQAR